MILTSTSLDLHCGSSMWPVEEEFLKTAEFQVSNMWREDKANYILYLF